MRDSGWERENAPDHILVFSDLCVALTLPVHWTLGQKSWSHLLKSFTISIIIYFTCYAQLCLGTRVVFEQRDTSAL